MLRDAFAVGYWAKAQYLQMTTSRIARYPDKRPGARIPSRQEIADDLFQLGAAAEGVSEHGLLAQFLKPPLDILMKMRFEYWLAASLLLAFGGLMGCKQESVVRPIHFIAPDKLTGFVQIIEDTTNGVELVSTNGRFIVAIPTNRIVRVRSIAPWTAPHEESAQYANGDPIPMDLSISSNVIALRSMGVIERNHHRILAYVIGTEQDRAKILETLSNGKEVP